ncbi:hypothetical protein AB4Z54_65110, partial [Streptomyces sp. MCAF7]
LRALAAAALVAAALAGCSSPQLATRSAEPAPTPATATTGTRLTALRALAAAALVAAALAGCSSPQLATRSAEPAPTPATATTGTRLTATLTSPVDATLRWTGTEPGAAGRIVEFATAPEGPYTILEYVPLGQTSYRHPDLMPQTPFYYRVRPYYGPA